VELKQEGDGMNVNENDFAKEIHDELVKDFPNARLKHAPHPGAKPTETARHRVGVAIEELQALIGDLNTLIAALNTIRDRL
jgi:hypothetical protein